ncbi:transcription factor TFIIIB component B'' homolog isoform X2 [Castor canadensis]|uniref:Transcription factor TFIIIB component B'' homolog isoform X2 n=1 Tax=Castor canadensis TaxID=51338 RepID=A0AC58MVK0_CASCN
MFRRARLSVKPNVRPGVGARSSTAPNPQRGQESPRPPEPAAESAPKPAEHTDVPAVDSGGAEPSGKAPGSSDEKTGSENNVEESNKSSSTVSQRRKRLSSTSSLAKPSVSVPPQSHPLGTINQGTPQSNPVPTKEKLPCSDRYRIYKAQKLREMLKEELRKEKKQWKNKYAINESQRPLDRSKMTMRDFIYYLPDNNPMTSSLEQEKKIEKSSTPVQTREQENKSTLDANDNEEMEEESDDGPLLVPRVKVAEDGSIILDEESLTVEVLRTKGPCVVEENDPIFERGSTTTYSSFRKNYYSKPWSNKETDMFFLAISMVGTDFSMIGQLFPHRARIEIKNKFKREEKTNGWRIDKAFQEKRPFDFDFFAHLLQKVLAEEEKRKQKSVKNQSVKEKSFKPRRNVKVKKVTREGVNDDPDESVSTKISDTERSQNDAQIVEEEESLISSGQDAGQVALEQDQNQNKRRKKNQDEANGQEAKNLLGSATLQSGPSEGEKHKDNSQPLMLEANEGECNKEEMLSCTENTDDIVQLASSAEHDKKPDPIISASNQQDTMPATTESLGSMSTSGLLSSEAEIAALCEVSNAESGGTEERNDDLKNKSVVTDQAQNSKLNLRGRLQRPKPNLSRAAGKKSGKTHAESKSLHSETPVEENHMEKGKMNTSDSSGMEHIERENPEAETGSNLGEKTCFQENNQPKAFRCARLTRGRMQRPKPNVVKATERKDVMISQEKIGATVEKNENESCVDRDIPQQMEDQSCKNFQCEDISQPEKKDPSFQNVQPDEPTVLNECVSIQEENAANILKQFPVLRTRFKKLKPNIGRGSTRKEISSKEKVPEEIPAPGEMTTTLSEILILDTSSMEKVPNTTTTTKELDSDFKGGGRSDISLKERMPEMTDVTVEMETDVKSTGKNISSREKMPELIDTTEEIDTDLEETREVSPQENGPEKVKPIIEMKTDLKEIGRGRTPGMIDSTEESETDLEETKGREIPVLPQAPEEGKTIGEMEIYSKGIIGEKSYKEEILVDVSAIGEREMDLKETGKTDISLVETVSGEMIATEETKADLKETGREVSLSWDRVSGDTDISEGMVADLERPGNVDICLRENEAEESGTSRQTETNTMQSGSGNCNPSPAQDMKNTSSEVVLVMYASIEEKEDSEKEASSHLSQLKTSSQNSVLCEAEDQLVQPPHVPEQLTDTNLSKSLPQEQKPVEVKSAPFVRSRFKRPKPNLARATLKRETTGAGKHAPEKKSEVDEVEAIVIQQGSEQTSTLSSQHDVGSLLISREKEKSNHQEEEAVILPCIHNEKDPSPSHSYEPKGELQLTQNQENDLVVSVGTQKINTFQQETKESVQTALPLRGRLQRPRPNVRRARQRQITEKGEAEGIINEEQVILQKDGTDKKSLTLSNSQIESEIEVVSSRVSECRVDENQSHVVPVEKLPVNAGNALDEKMSAGVQTQELASPIHENKPYVPSSAQLIRRQFQRAKPDLGKGLGKKEEPGREKGTTDQSEARQLEENLLQQGDSDTQLLLKEKAEILTSLEGSVRKDCVNSKEADLTKTDAQLEVVPSGSVGEEIAGDNSVSSVVEEQYLSKLTSRPQVLKGSNYSKIVPDRRTTTFSVSECETDHSGKRTHRKIKPNVTKGRGSKRIRGKTAKKEPRASKSMLVTLRASQEEDEDDAEDFESEYEEETCHLAPEELNKAPVFVPVGLRSPEPVSAQIEETMEELEITVNVADEGCVTVVEHQLLNTDMTLQEVKQEQNLNVPSFGMTLGEQTQDEPGPSDGSTEAAITLLTMGEIVLQSEISAEHGEVGVCVFPDVHSKDESHMRFSPDNVNHKINHEYQELSSCVISTSPASFEENKIVSEEQSTEEEVGLMEEVKENSTSTRNAASKVTNNLRMRSRFKPEPNLEILGTNRFDAYQEGPDGKEVEIQGETEKDASKATELEDKNLWPVTTAESKEQNQLACVHDIRGTSISQEANLTERNEDQEERCQGVQILSVVPIVSSQAGPHVLGSNWGLGESSLDEPLRKDCKGDSVLTLHMSECSTASVPEVQQENVIDPQDLAGNLFSNIHQDGDDEQAFILTLVEIPTSAAEEFTDASAQLMSSPLLPAPILVKSGNVEERGDMSVSLPVASVVQDAMCLSNYGRGDSEKPPDNLDLISRKRLHCRLDESDHVPPAKKCLLPPSADCQEYTSEMCSKELNVFEETEESFKEQDIFPTSGSTRATPAPQKEQLESALQNVGSRSPDKIRDPSIEKNMPQLPQDEMAVSDKEERTEAFSKSEQVDSRTSSSKTPLSRPGRRPLGFLSLICSKNNLESDETTQVHSKKRLKPVIPVSRRNLKRSNPLNESQKKNQEFSDRPPSPSVSNTESQNTAGSATQVSSEPPSLKEKHKSGQKRAPEEEPTTVSEYFFGDIFIEVDETE